MKVGRSTVWLGLVLLVSVAGAKDWLVTGLDNPKSAVVGYVHIGLHLELTKGVVLVPCDTVEIVGEGYVQIALQDAADPARGYRWTKEEKQRTETFHIGENLPEQVALGELYGAGQVRVCQDTGAWRTGIIASLAAATGEVVTTAPTWYQCVSDTFSNYFSIANHPLSAGPVGGRARVGHDTLTMTPIPPGRHFRYDPLGMPYPMKAMVWADTGVTLPPGESFFDVYYVVNCGMLPESFDCLVYDVRNWMVPMSLTVDLPPGAWTTLECEVRIPDTASPGSFDQVICKAAPLSAPGEWHSDWSGLVVGYPPPAIASVQPGFGARGQTLDITIHGSGFDDSTHVMFFPLDGSYPLDAGKRCGKTVHRMMIDKARPIKRNDGCHGIDRRKRCYIGTCFLREKHSDTCQLSFQLCKTHAAVADSLWYCTGEPNKKQRDSALSLMESEMQQSSIAASGINVNSECCLSPTDFTANITIGHLAFDSLRDVTVWNPDGQDASLMSCFSVFVPPGWSGEPAVANQTHGKAIKSGGSITAAGGQVYLLVGNNTRDFLRFSLDANSWIPLCSLPTGPKNKKGKKGACLVDNSASVFALKGGGTDEFYRYNVETNAWDLLPPPGFTKGVKAGFATVIELGGTEYVYAGSGSNTGEWRRFNLSTQLWEPATPAVLPVVKAKDGSGLVWDDSSRVYFLTGGGRENDFYYADLLAPTPTWVAAQDLPLTPPGLKRKKKSKEGGCLEYLDGRVYAVKGGSTEEFWSFDPGTGNWSYVGEVGNGAPEKGIKCGKSLAASFAAEGLFCLVGNNTNQFWFYAPAGTMAPPDNPQTGNPAGRRGLAFTLLPNPARGAAEVSYAPVPGESATLRVYDILGNLVRSARSESGRFRLRDLPAGTYLLRLKAGGSEADRRLVVVK